MATRINPKRKRRIKQRARKRAAQEHAGDKAALRSQKRAARRAYRSDIRSTRGAVDYLQNALSEAIGDVKGSGLKGRYARQVVSELAHQKADASNIVPMAKQSGRVELRDTLAGINEDLLAERNAQQSEARDAIRSALQDARQAKRERLKKQSENRKDRTRTVKNAHIIAQNKLDEANEIATAVIPPPPDDATDSEREDYQAALDKQQDARDFLRDLAGGEPSAVRLLAAQVASGAENVDQFDALEVIRRMVKPKNTARRIGQQVGSSVRDLYGG